MLMMGANALDGYVKGKNHIDLVKLKHLSLEKKRKLLNVLMIGVMT